MMRTMKDRQKENIMDKTDKNDNTCTSIQIRQT